MLPKNKLVYGSNVESSAARIIDLIFNHKMELERITLVIQLQLIYQQEII